MDRDLPKPQPDEDRDSDRSDDLSPIGAGCVLIAIGISGLAIALGLWIGGQLVQWECEVINHGPVVSMPEN